MKYLVRFTIITAIFLIFVSIQNTQSININLRKSEIQKCDYLIKALTPNRMNQSFWRKKIKDWFRRLISVCIILGSSYLIKKFIIEPFILKKAKMYYLSKIFLTPRDRRFDVCFDIMRKDLKSESSARFWEFACLIAPFVHLGVNFFLEDKEYSSREILINFIKNWLLHKINIPKKFQNKFNMLYMDYKNRNNVYFSDQEAFSIICKVLTDVLDYKSELLYGNSVAGIDGDMEIECENFKHKMEELPLSEEAKSELSRQINRLEKTSAKSTEFNMIKNHIETILALPWGSYTKDEIDIRKAQQILDENHYSLDLVKERILDFIALRTINKDCDIPILCFVGPPGVGKTSLGKSIACSLGKKFFRLSLGGVHDESEIRGHRQTYVGALPGRIVIALKNSGSFNPVIMLDEIDKVGRDSSNGNPCAALLEVLDPEQNCSFYDNYLGIHIDLSKVLFIATANDVSKIPDPLIDRMEVIFLPGYALEEKISIIQKYVLPKILKKTGLANKGFELDSKVIHKMVVNYTKEPGIREIERLIYKLCAKFARSLIEYDEKIKFNTRNLPLYLGSKVNLIGGA
ncbi:AAA family ATPase [Candidatus Dependentiae bacterium]|nr:AAA family ATPase [Candidatus Dependentiae bacterium]